MSAPASPLAGAMAAFGAMGASTPPPTPLAVLQPLDSRRVADALIRAIEHLEGDFADMAERVALAVEAAAFRSTAGDSR